jgi:hypothetical protein
MRSPAKQRLVVARRFSFLEKGGITLFLVAFFGLDYSLFESLWSLTGISGVVMAITGTSAYRFRTSRIRLTQGAEQTLLEEASARIRNWKFPLWDGWTLTGDKLAAAKAGTPLEVQFGSDEIEWAAPHRAIARLYEAGTEERPTVVFPKAIVNEQGNLTSYGDVAVLLGTDFGLEKWTLEQGENEKLYQWQLPRGQSA